MFLEGLALETEVGGRGPSMTGANSEVVSQCGIHNAFLIALEERWKARVRAERDLEGAWRDVRRVHQSVSSVLMMHAAVLGRLSGARIPLSRAVTNVCGIRECLNSDSTAFFKSATAFSHQEAVDGQAKP